MISNIANEFRSGRAAAVLYSSAGRLRFLPPEAVLGIGPALAAAPVPFAPPAYEGLVGSDGVLAAQFDLSQTLGGGARLGGYALLVDTAAGPLRLRVDTVSLAESAGDASPGLAEIAELTAGLAPAAALPPEAPLRTSEPDAEPFEALIVDSAGTTIALPATEVLRVERHRGSRPNRKGDLDERIVILEGDGLPGWSLAARLGAAATPEQEPWAVVLRLDGRPAVLTVAAIRGVVAVPRRRVRRIPHRHGVSVWLLGAGDDAGAGMIEVFDPAEFTASAAHPAPPAEPPPEPAPEAEPAERRAAERGRLAIGLGAFACVVPEPLIAGVLGETERARLSARRRPGACPVLDAGALLGLPGGGPATDRLLMIQPPGRRRFALLAPGLAPATQAPDWLPLPILPPLARRLFQAVRLHAASCDFLLRADAFDRPRDPALAGLVTNAHTGWLADF